MKLLNVAAAAVNQVPLDWDRNLQNITASIDDARRRGVSLLLLPELCIPGYGCEDAFHSAGTQQTSLEMLQQIVGQTEGIIVSVGLPLLFKNGLFNAACLLVDGRIAGFVCKQNLAGEGIHYEPRWFRPWPAGLRDELALDGKTYPLGDLMFDCGGVRIGFEICEDAWVARRPGAVMAGRGVDLILNPSASHFAFGKQEVRRRFVLEGSRAFSVGYLYANMLGNEAGRAIYDGGTMITSLGRMEAEGKRFSYREWIVTDAVIDVEACRMARTRQGGFTMEPVAAENIVPCEFAWPEQQPRPPRHDQDRWEAGPCVKEEEFTRAVALGLFDYLRKSRSGGFVVSISGGADSAAVSTLSALSLRFCLDQLGLDGLQEKLAHLTLEPGDGSVREIVWQLLTCVYQATRNSSDLTFQAARRLALALGARFMRFDVDAAVEGYVRMVSEQVGRPLTWRDDDVALQNIQARVRSPGVWLLANLNGSLLLSTSNRSEAAVGYATMDGDTSGGLSPIAGIDKAFLRHWLRWMETTGPEGIGPLLELDQINAQAPTAELRPPGAGQTDEGDLMPYDILDAIERAAIRDKHAPLDVLRVVRARFPDVPLIRLGLYVERFFTLWTRNQWKRERYAPSFHLDDENLDPKTWCRFPILSGGFRRELAQLRKVIEG